MPCLTQEQVEKKVEGHLYCLFLSSIWFLTPYLPFWSSNTTNSTLLGKTMSPLMLFIEHIEINISFSYLPYTMGVDPFWIEARPVIRDIYTSLIFHLPWVVDPPWIETRPVIRNIYPLIFHLPWVVDPPWIETRSGIRVIYTFLIFHLHVLRKLAKTTWIWHVQRIYENFKLKWKTDLK